jgi:hypothetical protein
VHQRLLNELVLRLARRALGIALNVREEECRERFSAFCKAFREEALLYEVQRERMEARLKAVAEPERVQS